MENLKTYKKLTTDTFNECIKGEAKHGGFCFPLNPEGVRELDKALIEALKGKEYMADRCYRCGGNPFELGQYFMVHDNLWKRVCRKHHIPQRALLCKDCFQRLLGRKLEEDDLTNCPLNIDNKQYIL